MLMRGLLRILQKHIKRQIISLIGGFQVIADLNAYHAFISSLKVGREFVSGDGGAALDEGRLMDLIGA
jgi:hypothetical protein